MKVLAENENTPLSLPVDPEDKTKVNRITKDLQSSVNYKTSRKLHEKWAEYERFWSSDQWPSVKQGTENFPRPVTNHFKEIIEMKVAATTYEAPNIYFEPRKTSLQEMEEIEVKPLNEEVEPFTIKQHELVLVAVEHVGEFNNIEDKLDETCRSTGLLGNGIMYSFWDNTVMGQGAGSFIGEIGVMEIDISDFHVGDPRQKELQKQPYIVITERRPRKQVIEDYESHSQYASMIQPESSSTLVKKTYDTEKTEQDEADYVDVIHHWEKKVVDVETEYGEDDEKDTVKTRKYQIDYHVVCQDYVLREEIDYCWNARYPFADMYWYPGRKSFYAASESDDLINNQKELNRLQGIAILGAYKTGLPDLLYKEDFIKKEDLKVGPGGHIISDSTPPGQGWGAQYLQPPNIAPYIPYLKDAMSQGMKDTSGAHEAWSGKAPSAHLNYSAIMALQEAAGVRMKGVRRRFYKMYKDLALVWLGLMAQYYTEERMYKVYSKDNDEGVAWMKPEYVSNFEYDVKASEGSASPFSKTVIATTLENMYDRQIIDGDTYLKLLPPEVFPRVLEILEIMDERVKEQEDMVWENQKQIIDEVVAETISQAKEQGIEISPETLQHMRQMIQAVAQEQEGQAHEGAEPVQGHS